MNRSPNAIERRGGCGGFKRIAPHRTSLVSSQPELALRIRAVDGYRRIQDVLGVGLVELTGRDSVLDYLGTGGALGECVTKVVRTLDHVSRVGDGDAVLLE